MEIKNTPYKMLDPENCVMCGMCLNNCPTYNISNNESESPRGRISIIHGLNESMLEPSQSALSHINSCTLCLACESICPAKVNFYQLMTDARNKYFKKQKMLFKVKTQLVSFLLTKSYLKKTIINIFNILNKKPLKKIFKFMNFIQLENIEANNNIINKKQNKNEVGIFLGCASAIFQKNVANDCMQILEKNNISSRIIENVECCGSLDYNSGKINKGIKHKEKLIKEFREKDYKKIIAYASGCSAFINKNIGNIDYQDATSYILEVLLNSNDNNFRITKKNICVHKPCTSKLANIDFDKLITLLNNIPDLNISVFEDNYCCGAGAQNLIHNKENSLNIIKPKINYIMSNNIEYVLTYNVGCSLNFINSLNINGINTTKVLHPITFLNKILIK